MNDLLEYIAFLERAISGYQNSVKELSDINADLFFWLFFQQLFIFLLITAVFWVGFYQDIYFFFLNLPRKMKDYANKFTRKD